MHVITFSPLWQTLKDRGITQYDLLNKYEMSRGMLDNLKHNRSITLNTLNDLCNMLDCNITDIIEYKKD
ncbi:helix-turn-helix domain-containing protein [Otoolea muris]|uniref:helix-turn-helix domain-containing protein n=1 Tax=Otoolea muris TaxID=2941515 RepID=UPI0023B987AC|nr:helix-turn-helix transcriptional regulator [Otoolea muris]